MSGHERNPVGRLYLVLEYISQRHDQNTNLNVLCELMHITPPAATPEMYSGIAALLNLPGQARAATGRYPAGPLDVEETLEEIARGERALLAMTALGNPLSIAKSEIDRGTLVGLRHASRSLEHSEPSPTLSEEERVAIREAAQHLIDAVRRDDGLPVEAKRVILEHAEAVLRALNLIDIGGVAELLREYDRLQGHARRDARPFAEASSRASVRKAMATFLLALGVVAKIINGVAQIEQSTEHVLELIVSQETDLADEPPSSPEQTTPLESP